VPVSAGTRWTPARLAVVGFVALAAAGLIVRGIVTWNEASAERLATACRAAHRAENYAAEEKLAAEWVGALPGAAEPLFFLAQAQLGLGKQREAAETMGLLPDGDPLTLIALGDRADLLFGDLQDPREAAQVCERILRIDPANGEAHRRLCFFYAPTRETRRPSPPGDRPRVRDPGSLRLRRRLRLADSLQHPDCQRPLAQGFP
jgi:tetratricopeptide (TPR) repeat protein